MLKILISRPARRAVLGCRLILLSVLISACDPAPLLNPLPPNAAILAFGDSLTWGTGADQAQSYPAQLSKLIGLPVINAGVPGETSAEGVLRLQGLLQEYQPNLVVLCEGGNDILRRLPLADTADHLQAMIDMARAQNIDVVLIGVPQFGIFLSTADLYDELAERNHLPIDDNMLGKILRQPALKSDHIHPNADGYALLARAVAELLVTHGALTPDK